MKRATLSFSYSRSLKNVHNKVFFAKELMLSESSVYITLGAFERTTKSYFRKEKHTT